MVLEPDACESLGGVHHRQTFAKAKELHERLDGRRSGDGDFDLGILRHRPKCARHVSFHLSVLAVLDEACELGDAAMVNDRRLDAVVRA